MINTGVFETRSAKVIAAVVAVLLLAAFQVALQAKPAHAWQMKVSISGAGSVVETTPAHLLNCSTTSTNPTGQVGATCFAGTPDGDYGNLWDVDYTATPATGYSFVRWESDGGANPIICDRSTPAATSSTYSGSNVCKFRATGNLQTRAVFADTTAPFSPGISGPSSFTNQQTATFNFFPSSDPTFKQYECRVVQTQASFSACNNPFSYAPAVDGFYTLEVRARDYSNNVSANPSTYSWTLDRAKPDTTLTSGVGPAPNSATQSTDATFSFSSPDSTVTTYECSLDNATFTFCSSPKPYTGLTNGSHTFQVRAVDRAGNRDDTPASRTWTVDNVAPSPPVINSPADNSPLNTSDFAVSGTAEANSHVELFDQGISKGTTQADASGNWSKTLSGVSDGSHTYTAKATDAANNTSGVSTATTVTVDAKDPTVTKWTPTGKRVSTGANAVAFFSEAMNGPTVEAPGTFTLKKKGTTKALGATVTYSVTTTSTGSTYKAVLNPTRNLKAGATYIAKLTPVATDLSGNPLVAKTWTFTVKS